MSAESEGEPRERVRRVVLRYLAANPGDGAAARRMLALIDAHPDCLLRTCRVGHVTASALVLSHDLQDCLLTHHKKLDRWLQLGGHVDGEGIPHLSALREAREESGMRDFAFFPDPDASGAEPLPIDLDVHPIPARKDEPEHEHHDVRYLLVAAKGQEPSLSDESNALRWFPLEQIAFGLAANDESLARLARKAIAVRSA